jgi:hypothetical protein
VQQRKVPEPEYSRRLAGLLQYRSAVVGSVLLLGFILLLSQHCILD